MIHSNLRQANVIWEFFCRIKSWRRFPVFFSYLEANPYNELSIKLVNGWTFGQCADQTRTSDEGSGVSQLTRFFRISLAVGVVVIATVAFLYGLFHGYSIMVSSRLSSFNGQLQIRWP